MHYKHIILEACNDAISLHCQICSSFSFIFSLFPIFINCNAYQGAHFSVKAKKNWKMYLQDGFRVGNAFVPKIQETNLKSQSGSQTSQ